MLYTEKEKNEIERIREVFKEHIRQITTYNLVWSYKVGYIQMTIFLDPFYVDTGNRIESAADLCWECLNDVAMDVMEMTGNDHDIGDPIRWNWPRLSGAGNPISTSLPEYAYICDDLLSGRK